MKCKFKIVVVTYIVC